MSISGAKLKKKHCRNISGGILDTGFTGNYLWPYQSSHLHNANT